MLLETRSIVSIAAVEVNSLVSSAAPFGPMLLSWRESTLRCTGMCWKTKAMAVQSASLTPDKFNSISPSHEYSFFKYLTS